MKKLHIILLLTTLILCLSCDDTEKACNPPLGTISATVVEASDLPANTIALQGSVHTGFEGVWKIIEGNGGSFANANMPQTTFSGLTGEMYILRWELKGCDIFNKDVSVTIGCETLQANAGADQQTTNTTITLNGNLPTGTTGLWTIVSGNNGQLTNPTQGNATFTGVAGNTYTLRWTLTNACGQTSFDELTINMTLSTDPAIHAISVNQAVNGEVVTLTGVNFAMNPNDGFPVIMVDNLNNSKVVWLVEPLASTTCIGHVSGTNGGDPGVYPIIYRKQMPDNSVIDYPSNLTIQIIPPGELFHVGSTTNVSTTQRGNIVSVGVKNGSLNSSDYSVKLVKATGDLQEFSAAISNISANGFSISGHPVMDALSFVVPNDIPLWSYIVVIEFNNKKYCANWNSLLSIN